MDIVKARVEAQQILTLAQKLVADLSADTPQPPQYAGLTDRVVHPKPAPWSLPAAGGSWLDPVFGAKLWRVTDQSSNGGGACHAPSSIGGAWNSDGTKFVVVGAGGNAIFYAFDGQKVTQLPNTIRNSWEPWFSYTNPNLVYAGVAPRVVKSWDLSSVKENIVIDLDVAYASLGMPPGYLGPVAVVDNDVYAVLFGGASQDQHQYIHHSQFGLFDSGSHGFKMHGFGLDRQGRMIVNPNAEGVAKGLPQVYVWDHATDSLTPLTKNGGGHLQLGYDQMVNQDCCSSSTWDSAQWQIRSLSSPDATKDLITPVLTPKSTTLSDHTSWRNARVGVASPILSSTFRTALPADQPWRAWDDEIVTIETDGSGVVKRHCHHQSIYVPGDYWSQPVAHVDPFGKYAIFTSNWGQTVGPNRQDVFLVALRG